MWSSWWHRRCERERAAERAEFVAELRRCKAAWGKRNKQVKEDADRRVSEALASARQQVAQAREEFAQELAAQNRLARALAESPRDQKCVKVRLNDKPHAEAMVAHVLETTGVRTEPYPCPVCPRQLFGRGRFWHVRTIDDPVERARRDRVKAGRAKAGPDRLALRLPPESIALMKERARE